MRSLAARWQAATLLFLFILPFVMLFGVAADPSLLFSGQIDPLVTRGVLIALGASPLIKLQPFQNVAANQTAVLPEIPQVMIYEGILLQLGGTFTKAQITGLRLWLGGKKIWEITGTHLDSLNQYYKRTAGATFLQMWFANPNAFDMASYMAGAIDTSVGYSNFWMEADIGGATGPTLAAYSLRSAPPDKDPAFPGMIRSILKSINAPASAAEFTIPVPMGGRGGALFRAVHYFHTNITKLQVLKDSFPLLQEGTNAVVQYYENELYRTTQAGLISWDPTQQNDDRDAVPTVKGVDSNGQNVLSTFEHKVTVSAADTLTIYPDLLTTP